MNDTLEISAFKHVVVPLGVVIALGVARLVSAASEYTQKRDRVDFSLAHTIWSLILFLWFVGLWWIAWGLRLAHADLWTFFALIFLLLGPSLMFMAASLLVPEVPSEGRLDLGERLHTLGRPFFLCLFGVIVWLATAELWLLQEPFWILPKRGFQATALCLFAVGATWPTRRVTVVLGLVMLPLIVTALAMVRGKLA